MPWQIAREQGYPDGGGVWASFINTPTNSFARKLNSAGSRAAPRTPGLGIEGLLDFGKEFRWPATGCEPSSPRSRPDTMGRATHKGTSFGSRDSGSLRDSLLPAPDRATIRAPFDAIAATYDETFTNSRIGRAQRDTIWHELDRVFRPGQHILEINCGTGVDAIYLASRGVDVLACDSAPRMIEVARKRLLKAQPCSKPPSGRRWGRVDFRVLATEEIGKLQQPNSRTQFAGAFSNFAGLNCVEDLSHVARGLARLLQPGAPAVLCLFGRFCAWEVLWYLAHGNPRKAFRRLRYGGDLAELAPGATVRVRYPGVRALARAFAPAFRLKRWKGVGVVVPPSYLEPLAERFSKSFDRVASLDRWIGRCPVVRGAADHVLLTFERAMT